MKKLFLTLAILILANISHASVTMVKWGVDVQQNLRFVFDLTELADFDVDMENNNMIVTVQTPFDGEEKAEKIASEFAEEMYVQAAGTKTVLRVPFVKNIEPERIRAFTLKQDPVTNRPSRIVIDVLKNMPAGINQETKVSNAPVVSAVPKVVVGNAPSPVKPAPPVAAEEENKAHVVLQDPQKTIAKIPEIKRATVAVNEAKAPVVGSSPVRSVAQENKVKEEVLEKVETIINGENKNVVVGSSPTNKSEAQARAMQKGKESVAEILKKAGSTVVQKTSPKPASGKNTIETKIDKAVDKIAGTISDVSKNKIPAESTKKAVDKIKDKLINSVSNKVPEIQIVTSSNTNKSKETKSEKKTTTQTKGTQSKNSGTYHTKGGIKGKIITIDPGHGGSDPGAVSNKGTYEKTITLSMAKKLKADLEKMGAKVYLTRSTDTDVSEPYADDEVELQARVDIAEKYQSDLFISLHINASVNKKASGISTYYYPKNNYDIKLANCIHKQLTSNFGLTDMGAREANFYVTKRCYMPAVLMELGFITNSKEEKTISGNWFQDKAMGLVAKGIEDYFK